MINNIESNSNDLPEFDPTEFGGDELGRCKSYLKTTVQYLEEECRKTAALINENDSLRERIAELNRKLFWQTNAYDGYKKYLLKSIQ